MKMAEYIDREALLKTIFPYDVADKSKYTINAKAVEKAIKGATTADVVEVRHAYWKTVTEIRDNTVCGDGVKFQYRICSNCETPMGLTGEDYCGCCGAKMDGERKEQK